jgi:hypothetical protein
MGTFVIESTNFSLESQIKNVDLTTISDDDSPFICIVRPSDYNTSTGGTPENLAKTNLCFAEFVKNAIPFEVPNSLNVMTTYGGKMTSSWNGLDTAFPNGFIMLSPEQVIDTNGGSSKTLSFTVYNKNIDSEYRIDMGRISTILLYNSVLDSTNQGNFSSNYTVYNPNGTIHTSSISLGPQNNLRYKYVLNQTNIFIPKDGYITFSVTRANVKEDIDVYLLISLTGITIAKPVISFSENNKSITTTYENQNNDLSKINIDITRNIAGATLIDASIQLIFTNTSAIQKATELIKLTSNTKLSYLLPYRFLDVGEYSVRAIYSQQSSNFPSYFASESVSSLSYTITKTVLSTTLTVPSNNLSYNENMTFNAIVQDNTKTTTYTNEQIAGVMTLHYTSASHSTQTCNMGWDSSVSAYTVVRNPSTHQLFTGETYSFHTTFASTNTSNYNISSSTSASKTITVNGLAISLTDNSESTSHTIGLTETITVSLKINDANNASNVYTSILSYGKMSVSIYNTQSPPVLIGTKDDIGSSYIITPQNTDLSLMPGSYNAIFKFVSNVGYSYITVSNSNSFGFIINNNTMSITSASFAATYGVDLQLSVSTTIASNGIILTRNQISGTNKTTNIVFNVYANDGTTLIKTSTIASYDDTSKSYTASIPTVDLINTNYKVIATTDATSTNVFPILNSAFVPIKINPQTATITITKPDDGLTVEQAEELYLYTDDVFVDKTNYIFEYNWNTSFTINGTVNILGALITDNIKGNLELYLKDVSGNTYNKITTAGVVTQTDNTPAAFTLTILSPSALGITTTSLTPRQFYIQWVPTSQQLYNTVNSSLSNSTTSIRSLKAYTIFNKDFNCIGNVSSITYESEATFTGLAIQYMRASLLSTDDPMNNSITYVPGTYELKYATNASATKDEFISFGKTGYKVIVNNSTDKAIFTFSSSLFVNNSTTIKLSVGTYYVKMFFTPNDVNAYYDCHSSVNRTIMITKEPISTDVNMQMYLKNSTTALTSTSQIDNNTPIYLSLSAIKSKGKNTPLVGTVDFGVVKDPVINNIVLYQTLTNLFTPPFTAAEQGLSSSSNTFYAKFTPTDQNYDSITLTNIRSFNSTSLVFDTLTITTPVDYEQLLTVSAKLISFKKGSGAILPVSGKIYMYADSDTSPPLTLLPLIKTIDSDNLFTVFSGTAKDLKLNVNSANYTIIVKFVPDNLNIDSCSKSTNLSVSKKTIDYTTVTIDGANTISKSYDEAITVKANIPTGISGKIHFKMILSTSSTISLGDPVDINTSTGNATLSICGYDFVDITTSVQYSIIAEFIATANSNYADGQITQNSTKLTFIQISIYLSSLFINGAEQSLSSAYYKGGISIQAGGTITFTGAVKSSTNSSKTVKLGSIQLISKITSAIPTPALTASINPVNGTFTFTLGIGPGNSSISISTSYYLQYTGNTYYNSRSLLHTVAPIAPASSIVPGRYYINVDTIQYDMTISRTAISQPNYTTDYHNGNIEFNAIINQDLIPDAKSIYDVATYNNDKKGGIVFVIMNTQGTVICRHEIKPLFDTENNKTYASWKFCPRTLLLTSGQTGLSIGSYNVKCYFEGIPGYYLSQDAIYNNTQYFVPFDVTQTQMVITTSLTQATVVYKQQPYLNISVKTPLSLTDIAGNTILTYGPNANPTQNSLDVTSTATTTGTLSNTNNTVKITNIIGTTKMRMPIIPASSSQYTILMSFTPVDTVNYTSITSTLSYVVNKYTPLIDTSASSLTIKPSPDGSKASNIDDIRAVEDYKSGLINYDEPIKVVFNITKDNEDTDTIYNEGYASIAVSDIIYKYSSIPVSSYTTFSKNNDFVNGLTYKPIDSTNLSWTATIKAQKIPYVNGDVTNDYSLQIVFVPTDTTNYNSRTVESTFSIYIANSLGSLTLTNYASKSLPLTYNAQATFTIGANVQYLNTVAESDYVANITLFYDTINDNTKKLNSTPLNITTKGEYDISFSTSDTNKLLTARQSAYFIYGILDPVSPNYPSINQGTPFQLTINPSVEITITNANSSSVVPAAEYNTTPFKISAVIKTGNATNYSGTITFNIKNQTSTITYTRVLVITNQTDNKEFSFFTNDKDTNGNYLYDLPINTYTVTCDVEFTDKAYNNVSQNTPKSFNVINRNAPFNIELTKNRIIYGDTHPTLTVTFTDDEVYDGSMSFTFTPKNGITILNKSYAIDTTLLTKKKKYELIPLPANMNVNEYSISASFIGTNFGLTNSSTTIVFVISKLDVILTPGSKYYSINSVKESLPLISVSTNVNVINGSITLVNTTTNSSHTITTYNVFTKTFTLSSSLLLSILNITNAGSYELAMYYNGDDTLGNYNKSSVVFTNLIVKRKELTNVALVLDKSPEDPSYNFSFIVSTETNTTVGDKVELYSICKSGNLIIPSSNLLVDKKITSSDSNFNKGDTEIYAIITNSNYSMKTSVLKITKPGINISSLTLTTSSTTVKYNVPITITATLVANRLTVNDGRVLFYVGGSIPEERCIIGSANVVANVALLNNVLLTNIGVNKIYAQYMDSFIYNDFPSSGYSGSIDITISKTLTTVALSSVELTDVMLTSIREIKATLSIGTFVQSGTMTFKEGSNVIYDDVPVIDGVATIQLYVDKAYNLTAIYNGNEYLDASVLSPSLIITLAAQQNAISDYYDTPSSSKTLYNTSSSTTASMILTANISAKVKNIVHDNNGYFIFKVGNDERKVYATGNSSSSIYTASTSYTYLTAPSPPSFTIDYQNDNYSGKISVAI